MGQIFVTHSLWWKRFVSRQENVLHDPLPVNVVILLMIPFFFHKLPSRSTLSAEIEQRALLSHDSRKARGVIAKAGGIAHQESFWILQQRLDSIGVLAAVLPRKNSAMGYPHNGRTNPLVVARVLQTSNNTRIIPTNGTKPAVMMIESKECVARD